MKKKINSGMIFIALVSIFASVLLITVVYYDLFHSQVIRDLKTYAALVRRYDTESDYRESGEMLHREGLRLTLVGADGQVVYDNGADETEMENHMERPEIRAAFDHGEGEDVRKSETMTRSTFYYAVLLENGNVLRVAKQADSLFHVFVRELPRLVLVVCFLMLVSMVLAHFLTGKLVAPIEKMTRNMEGQTDLADYEELIPFIDTIQKQHEDILKNARIRQEFTANVSHELKTPLTSISGYAELIESGMASEADTVRFAQGIHKSANRLLTLINDIIRLSELDGTDEDTDFEQLNLYQLAETCVDMLYMNAEKHQVSIELKGMDSYVNGNRQMMEELLYNLCDNAIRYNNVNGSVTVEVYPRPKQTVLVVRDTGIGIPKEHQERIFERFYRVDKSRSKSTGGTGLGLAIVKHILVKHNASIDLVSESGKGTVITVTFTNE